MSWEAGLVWAYVTLVILLSGHYCDPTETNFSLWREYQPVIVADNITMGCFGR